MQDKINGVIFDFNGVIINDSWLHEKSWLEVFRELVPNENHSIDSIQKLIHGRINKDIFESIYNKNIPTEEIERLSEFKEQKYRLLFKENLKQVQLDKHTIYLFEYLKNNDVPFTIATASGLSNLKFFFEILSLSNWFDFDKIAYDDGTILGKPEPDIYIKAAKNISTNIENCLVIEDAVSGIKAAHSAGASYIVGFGVSYPHDVLIKHGANIAIQSFSTFPYNKLNEK